MMGISRAAIILTAGLFSTALLATSAAASWTKHHAKKHHSHKHHYYMGYDLKNHATKYAPQFHYGHRPDCHMLKRRARLTGNAYWRYAAHSCVHDYYKVK